MWKMKSNRIERHHMDLKQGSCDKRKKFLLLQFLFWLGMFIMKKMVTVQQACAFTAYAVRKRRFGKSKSHCEAILNGF